MATFRLWTSTENEFEFAGNNRAAKIQVNDDILLTFRAVDRGGVPVVFPSCDLSIKSATIICGIPDLVAGDRTAVEATLLFATNDGDDVPDNIVAKVPIVITKWDCVEQQKLTCQLKASEAIDVFLAKDSIINIMDFNVQSDWVGQKFTPIIELTIETDHLLTTNGEVLF